jgi:hypothetical protein
MLAGRLRRTVLIAAAALAATASRSQVIEYEANGQKYQTLTRKGLTVIVTHMPKEMRDFGLLQVSISNGSQMYWTVRPEDFAYIRGEAVLQALPARSVVDILLERANHSDVVRLVTAYEAALYGIPHMRSTNGYEQRRQNAMSEGMPARLKAAATASAIALSQARLAPGQSTDGAVFIPISHEVKMLTGGRIVFRSGSETFEFNPD